MEQEVRRKQIESRMNIPLRKLAEKGTITWLDGTWWLWVLLDGAVKAILLVIPLFVTFLILGMFWFISFGYVRASCLIGTIDKIIDSINPSWKEVRWKECMESQQRKGEEE